jgi:hypothetical protein
MQSNSSFGTLTFFDLVRHGLVVAPGDVVTGLLGGRLLGLFGYDVE